MSAFALLTYDGRNIGDQVQSLAARQFLPRVDRHVNRDDLAILTYPRPTYLVANGWYSNRPQHWPPESTNLRLLPLSIHLSLRDDASIKAYSSPEAIDFLNRVGPVGARDAATEQFLGDLGVASYFSGCLTLTLKSGHPPSTQDVLFIDVPERIVERLEHDLGVRGRRLSQVAPAATARRYVPEPLRRSWKYRMAAARLAEIDNASLVVTSRLHVALPCRALSTPVTLIAKTDDPRFSGYEDLLSIRSPDEVMDAGSSCIEQSTPTSIAPVLSKLRSGLERRITEFVMEAEHG